MLRVERSPVQISVCKPTDLNEQSCVTLSPSRQIQGQYLSLTTSMTARVRLNKLFTNNPYIRRFMPDRLIVLLKKT